ncbi:MAG: DUF2523 family protein [Ignavibacteriae bacterium]|nr:DUF2523 family protein [Ignavibacteriota bacterium]
MNIDLSFIANFFNDVGNILTSFLTWVLTGIAELVSGVLYVIFDGFFTVVLALISAIDFSTVLTANFGQWSSLPVQLIYLINAVGIPQGMSMVGAAYVIRMTLNLIPGTISRV